MTGKSIRAVAFIAMAFLAGSWAFGRSSQTQATNPAGYDYKVEIVKHKTDLEERLKVDSRSGWRVQQVVATPDDNQIVVILERPASTP